MKNYKTLFAAGLTAALAIGAAAAVQAEETKLEFTINNAYMKVNGVPAEIDPGKGTAPVIADGRTLLPIRAVVEAMGGTAEWDAETKTTTLKKDDDNIQLTIGSKTAYLNGSADTLDTAPVIINGRTMLPLRFIAEGFGFVTDWDAETKSITVTQGKAAVEYDNSDWRYNERGGTDGKIYAIDADDATIFVLGKDKKPEAVYTYMGSTGVVYSDEAGKMYMLNVDLENQKYELIKKGGDAVTFDDITETAVSLDAQGSDGMLYKSLASRTMYVCDKDGKTVNKLTQTGEYDAVYADENGGKLLYAHAKNGGPDDYITGEGTSAMLEREYFVTYLGSDGLTYTWANETLVVLDDEFNVMRELPFVNDYELLDLDDDTYTLHHESPIVSVLESMDGKKVTLTYDENDERNKAADTERVYYLGSDGKAYSIVPGGVTVHGKAGKAEAEFENLGYCVEYKDKAKDEIYTLVYGSDDMTIIMPRGESVKLMETYG
ncbi:MAG: copper amine oxidase N-terminal domain-containing protein [Firmicutes bacterium]|nr:copper amine oxidase N-terminal domain-containing protein [Bacillota bacterium]